MKLQNAINKLTVIFFASLIFSASATIVQLETNMGNFEVNLYDNDTPLTVANFLGYVGDGDYDSSVFHRAVPGFVIQGGGFKLGAPAVWPLDTVNVNPSVNNEPVYSNVRGTIAMARLGGQPNSATNQWFINISNNSDLDSVDNGFTVFGQVVGDGMNIVDTMMTLPRFDFGGALNEIPLQNFTVGNDPDATNLIVITSIQVIDPLVNTTAGLTRPLSTNMPINPGQNSGGGGGALGGLMIILLFGRVFRKRA